MVGATRGDLDVHAHADAELVAVATRATCGLLFAQVGIVRRSQHQVECTFVVADVVFLTNGSGVGLHELADEIFATNFGGVEADLGSKHIHCSFDGGGGFGATSTAIRNDWRGVGDHRLGAAFDFWNRVYAAAHRASARGGQHGTNVNERARILNRFKTVGEHLAVAVATESDVLQLCATVTKRDHRFAAGFAPAQRAIDRECQATQHDFFGVGRNFCTKPAADVGGNHPHVTGGVTFVDLVAHTLSVLRGDPLKQSTINPSHGRTAHLERARCQPLVDKATLHHHFAVGEKIITRHIGHAPHCGVDDDIAAGIGVDER